MTDSEQAIATILHALQKAEPETAFVMVRIERTGRGNVIVAVPEGADSTAVLAATQGIIDDEIAERLDGAA